MVEELAWRLVGNLLISRIDCELESVLVDVGFWIRKINFCDHEGH